MLDFLSGGKLAALAQSLAQELAKRYPPAIANNPAQVVSRQRLSEILQQVSACAADLSPENRLRWYDRVRLGRCFRRALSELGYDDNFIDFAAESVILCGGRNTSFRT